MERKGAGVGKRNLVEDFDGEIYRGYYTMAR